MGHEDNTDYHTDAPLRNEVMRLCNLVEKERENFIALTKELSNISGSLKVLLEDRSESKAAVQRMFSAIDDLRNRMTAVETQQATMSSTQTTAAQRGWHIFSMFIGPAVTAIITYLFFAKR